MTLAAAFMTAMAFVATACRLAALSLRITSFRLASSSLMRMMHLVLLLSLAACRLPSNRLLYCRLPSTILLLAILQHYGLADLPLVVLLYYLSRDILKLESDATCGLSLALSSLLYCRCRLPLPPCCIIAYGGVCIWQLLSLVACRLGVCYLTPCRPLPSR